jgi:hypothetical protein
MAGLAGNLRDMRYLFRVRDGCGILSGGDAAGNAGGGLQ